MPRANPGPANQKRAWSLIEALVLAKVGSEAQAVVAGVELEYLNWKPRSKSAPQIRVKAQLTKLSKLTKSKLDGEHIREIISLYLGEKFLGILEDKRRIKYGKGAENWHFILTLWSTDLEENRQEFNLAWKRRKSGETEEPVSLDLLESTQKNQANSSDIDELVREVRSLYQDKIQYDCGEMQLLNRQVPIDELYTDVYILEDTPKLRSLNISKRMQGFDPIADDPNSFYLGKVRGERVPGLEMVTDGCKVMCLGAPGSGKTTYLYYVAIQCNKGELQANRVPIFLRLIDFTDTIKNQPELSLLNYIENLFHTEGVEQPQAIETIITQGRALILLDGLDEVPKDFSKLVLSRIREFCKYRKNSIIITCRTNALDYNFSDLKFTQVIVADFEQPQIEIFANKWFVAGAKNDKQAGEARAKEFIEKLGLPEHKRIRDLAVTPILLNLTCLIFKNNLGEFPKNRSELYQRGINILLEEWDAERGIERDEVYGKLDLEGRKALLTHVAKVSFEENRYFFKQEEIEKYIADYLRTLPHARIDSLQRDSRAVLKSIEVQHGLLMERAPEIYSFSHLTFQEYFTAKWFCDQDWKSLVKYVTELRWREIFLLAVQILQPPDELLQLMKQQIDLFLWRHEKKHEFQNFLAQLKEKALLIKTSNEIIITWFGKSFKIPYKLSSVCAFYLAIDPNIVRSLDLYYDLVGFRLASGKNLHFPLDNQLNLDLYLTNAYQAAYNNFGLDINDSLTRVHTIVSTLDPELDQSLYNLERQLKDRKTFLKLIKEELPKELTPKEALKFFWFAWAEQLRTLVFKHRRICQDWRFSDQQKKLLQQYYDANKLLIDSLNSSHVVSNEVREEIEKNLLLPFDVIENSQQQM